MQIVLKELSTTMVLLGILHANDKMKTDLNSSITGVRKKMEAFDSFLACILVIKFMLTLIIIFIEHCKIKRCQLVVVNEHQN